jgi:hypothetical protein
MKQNPSGYTGHDEDSLRPFEVAWKFLPRLVNQTVNGVDRHVCDLMEAILHGRGKVWFRMLLLPFYHLQMDVTIHSTLFAASSGTPPARLRTTDLE